MPAAQRSQSPRGDRDATEASPLLVDADTEASTLVGTNGYGSNASTPTDGSTIGEGGAAKPAPAPLDKKQLLLLCYLRMTEPMAFFCIFPFIAQMVKRNGHLPDEDIGFYSGLIESLFSATQMFVLVGWGRLADTIGRRPVLLCSLAGSTLGTFLFGFSTTLWQMILFRCIAGVFSGSGLIIRTLIAEISTPDTQALAFSWFAFASNMGIFLGPILGGVLAEPAGQYPGLFGGWKFFIDYPYALPGIATAAMNLSGLILGVFYVKETLKKQKKAGDDEATEAQTGTAAVSESVPSTWELFKTPGVGMVFWATGHVMILAFAFTALLPVVLFEPVELGGAGFTTSQISIFMAVQGASQAAWMLLAFPKLQRKLGTKGVLKLCGNVYPFCFLAYIGLNLILRNGSPAAMAWFWIIGPVVMVVMPGVAMAFIAVQLALNDVSPSPQLLGTLNALALTLTSAIRSIVPGAFTAIYAIGLRHHLLGGHLAWVILTPLALAFGIGCRYLPEKPTVKNDDDEQDS